MKIGTFRKYWIVVASIWVVFITSLKLIGRSIFGVLKGKNVTAIGLCMSTNLLKIVRADYKIIEHYRNDFATKRPIIIMSNHRSHYDIPLIFCTFPKLNIRMIAKKELFAVPVWGRAMRVADFISVDRQNRKQAIKDLHIAKEKMSKGIILWIAPEGTRSRTGKLEPFKKGGFKLAMQTGAMIVPVCIVGSEKILPPKTLDFSLGEKVQVHVAAAIDATQYQDVTMLMQAVESAIKQAGNIK